MQGICCVLRNEIPTLSERRFRKERKVNGTERKQFGNFFLTRTVVGFVTTCAILNFQASKMVCSYLVSCVTHTLLSKFA